MVEERDIAVSDDICPVHPTIEETHRSYNRNMTLCLENLTETGKMMIASHNTESIEIGMKKIKELGFEGEIKQNAIFAQLFGLGDHLSALLLNENYNILRYIPFGAAEIMLPYLIRRAQESKQMLSTVHLSIELVHHELKQRLFRR